jgi:hypothetical protein
MKNKNTKAYMLVHKCKDKIEINLSIQFENKTSKSKSELVHKIKSKNKRWSKKL